MKIAVSSTGSSSDASVSEKFGRCSYFVIYDTQTKAISVIANPAENVEHGAGPKAAQLVIHENIEVVLTGTVGGNADEALKKGGVKIVTGLTNSMKVLEAIDLYLNSKLT